MGITLLCGRRTKLNYILHDSMTRTTILKNRHQSLLSFETSDVVELLKLGLTKQAILRVEHVIHSSNMLETLSMVEKYCQLLAKRVSQIERNRDFPEELNEAILTLVYASTRIGEFPELIHLRDYFTSRFGNEYVTQCIEFPLFSSVNEKIVRNLSRRKPSLETRMRFLKEIASKNGIIPNLDVDFRQGEENGKATHLHRNTMTINQVLTREG